MDLAFRVYNNGERLVLACFPEHGGEALLRKSWDLESICLQSERVPDRRDMPFGKHKIPSKKSLVRGGFVVEISYDKQIVEVTPKNRQNKSLDIKSCVYNFEDLGIKYMPEANGFNLDRRELRASLSSDPVKEG